MGIKKLIEKKYYSIFVFGCAMNISDAERIKAVMDQHGYKQRQNNTDIIILVACSVRQSPIDRIWGILNKVKSRKSKVKNFPNRKPIVVLTGCVLPEDINKFAPRVDIIVDINNIKNIPELIIHGAVEKKIKKTNKLRYFEVEPIRKSKFSALVPIMTGCDNFCSYCAVPYTRGREYSRPAYEIIKEIKKLVSKGYKEIILLGQNVNSYKSKVNNATMRRLNNNTIARLPHGSIVNFPILLRAVSLIPGNFWIRFFTSHPKDLSDELIKTIKECDKVCRHINLPAQSGDNDILKAMNRKYTVGEYKKLIQKLKKSIPKIAISTDIIVGFPGETKKQFEHTARLLQEVEYDMAYIARYSPRPNTKAVELDDNVSHQEKKRREQVLTKILKKTALKNNKKYIGKQVEILVEKKIDNHYYWGKTNSYKHIKIKSPKNLCGRFANAKVISATTWALKGILVDN